MNTKFTLKNLDIRYEHADYCCIKSKNYVLKI